MRNRDQVFCDGCGRALPNFSDAPQAYCARCFDPCLETKSQREEEYFRELANQSCQESEESGEIVLL
jgi:hypothetical protein